MSLIQFKSGSFLQDIQNRRRNVSGRTAAARIRVPTDLAWWYWHEYGTASRDTTGDTKWPGGYPIVPVNAKVLAFPDGNGGIREHYRVWHPGVYPRAIVRQVLDQIINEAIQDHLQLAMRGDMEAVQRSLVELSLPRAKELIVENMAQQLPGTRVDGKLHGQTAANVFETSAEIVDTSI